MRKLTLYLVVAAVLGATAWATDVVVAPTAPAGSPLVTDDYDATLELKYDTGTQQYFVATFTGAGVWVGNDFDISAISEYRAITRIRVYSNPAWPNTKWDGFNVGIFDFRSGVPGTLIWGPRYVKPARAGYGWCNCSVNWTLPAANRRFVAAFEQFYNYPNMDPYAVDNNPTFLGHSWRYYGGSWRLLPGFGGYRNLMLRVVVNNVTVGVTPASLGRVKALYH